MYFVMVMLEAEELDAPEPHREEELPDFWILDPNWKWNPEEGVPGSESEEEAELPSSTQKMLTGKNTNHDRPLHPREVLSCRATLIGRKGLLSSRWCQWEKVHPLNEKRGHILQVSSFSRWLNAYGWGLGGVSAVWLYKLDCCWPLVFWHGAIC